MYPPGNPYDEAKAKAKTMHLQNMMIDWIETCTSNHIYIRAPQKKGPLSRLRSNVIPSPGGVHIVKRFPQHALATLLVDVILISNRFLELRCNRLIADDNLLR